MITPEELEIIIRSRIESAEKLGEQSGGSGHMGYVDYNIDKIEEPVLTDEGYTVSYSYTLIISTEFTYEPDNPPYRVPVSKSMLIDKELIEGQA
jgi:hypothetical protein